MKSIIQVTNAKQNLIFLLLISTILFYPLYGQELGVLDSIQLENFLENPKLNEVVKNYYWGRINISDNIETFSLLDTITEQNDMFFPIYFHTLNEIIKMSDGAVAEILGDYCYKMLCNNPGEAFDYLIKDRTMLLKYARYLGYEFSFAKDNISSNEIYLKELKTKLEMSLDLSKNKVKNTLDEFMKEIEITITEMN